MPASMHLPTTHPPFSTLFPSRSQEAAAMSFSMGRFVRRFIDREPVVSFSIAISVFGLSMPFWVTPLRESMGLQTEQYYLPSERSSK